MKLIDQLALTVGTKAACAALAMPRATVYRHRARRDSARPPCIARRSSRALTTAERENVLATLNKPEFADLAVPQVYAQMLDQGRFLCSIRTMYRILQAQQCVRERRQQLRHPSYTKPELLASTPNQVWSWDITKLPGPRKWTSFHLYVVLDIYSRYVVGWMVASRESAELAQRLVRDACERHRVRPDQLTIHSDRGPSMTSKPLALLYADLGIVRSLSRPHTSNDNPFSEAQFKTLKYRPDFPDRFGSVEDARQRSAVLFDWYNNEHRHSSLALLTPADVHLGRVASRLAIRNRALAAAFEATPQRFVHGQPNAPRPPEQAWINPPPQSSAQPLPASMAAH